MKFLIAVMLSIFSVVSFASAETVNESSGFFAFLENAPGWLVAILGVVVALQGIAALTETKKDDEILAKIATFLKAIIGLRRP